MKRSWRLNDLYVREEYGKHGAGKLLLDAAKAYATQTLSKGLELSTATHNQIAQRLYESNGYKRDEEYVHYDLNL